MTELTLPDRVAYERQELFDFAMAATTARPISEYHEDMGPVLWWKFPITEPPYVGSPNDCGREVMVEIEMFMVTLMGQCGEETGYSFSRMVGGWPGYHTHFTPIPIPKAP